MVRHDFRLSIEHVRVTPLPKRGILRTTLKRVGGMVDCLNSVRARLIVLRVTGEQSGGHAALQYDTGLK